MVARRSALNRIFSSVPFTIPCWAANWTSRSWRFEKTPFGSAKRLHTGLKDKVKILFPLQTPL